MTPEPTCGVVIDTDIFGAPIYATPQPATDGEQDPPETPLS